MSKIENDAGRISKSNPLNVLTLQDLFMRAILKGDAYKWTNVSYDSAAADTVVGGRNNSRTHALVIMDVRVQGDVESNITQHVVEDPITIAGTAIIGHNLNMARFAASVPDADFYGDETGAATQGDIIDDLRMTADNPQGLRFDHPLILGHGQYMGIDYVTDPAECQCTVTGFFLKNEELAAFSLS
jgi:hypothetical protein